MFHSFAKFESGPVLIFSNVSEMLRYNWTFCNHKISAKLNERQKIYVLRPNIFVLKPKTY